ncbi:Uncharacterized protein TPAR_06484 [Tolypocladium paradoxum]|uniref:Uncharacterized protein n=1 Tax=Tolypocladium paradoxum TaxID=94208 RepID=A0A2S4KT10_9HYPO|nr:Uncharacterized protein TPAR_06484 [Tolypocladium paradoxum]
MSSSGHKGRRWADNVLEEPLPAAGLKQQRTDNGVQQRLPSHDDYTVGWVCALPLELGAARGMLDEEHEILPSRLGDSNTYTFGRIGRHNIVLACLPDYGTARAATVASNMRRSFPKIQIGLMVGIGGGVPGGGGGADIRLGDVVVGDLVVQYDLGKTVCHGRFERTGGSGRPPPVSLATAVKTLRGHHMLKPSRIPDILAEMLERHPRMAARYARPVAAPDRLFNAAYDHPELSGGGGAATCDDCNASRLLARPTRSDEHPIIHYGKIASGNQVIKHGVTRDRVAGDLGAVCFEMEAAGLVDAGFPCLVVRGISDYADSHKNKRWQEYAAATAAAYAKELLSVISANTPQQVLPVERSLLDLPGRRGVFLESLRFDEMDSRQLTVKKAHPETCDWLLNHSDYLHWLDPDEYANHHGFLWISGKPGTGKSTLMNFACEHEKSSKRGGAAAATIAFFFNARGAEIEKSTAGMYRSLIVQLLHKLPDLQQVLDPHLDLFPRTQKVQKGKRSSYSRDIETLRNIFATAVEKLGNTRLTCFIDALDECDDDQVQDMVDHFENLGERAVKVGIKLYICFSSRHYPHITVQYSRRLTLEKQTGHAHDLERYVRNKLKAGASPKVNDVREEILRKADGVFLWVILVVDILNKEFKNGRIFAVRRRLQEIPDRLSELFRDMLRRDSANFGDLRLCIQWILFTKRPLRREEFYYALASGLSTDSELRTELISESATVDDMNNYVISSSKGLAESAEASKNPTVQFIHESVRDFLFKDNGIRELWPEFGDDFESQSHETLKKCCHTYISVVSTFDYVIRDRGTHLSPPEAEKALRRLPFLEYAARHVLDHADSAAATTPQHGFLKEFDLRAWIKQRNICEKLKSRRYTQNANILYILAEKNLARLIQTVLQDDPRIDIPGERHRYPLFAALANSHRDAVRALLHIPGEVPLGNLHGWQSAGLHQLNLELETPRVEPSLESLDPGDRHRQTSLRCTAKGSHGILVSVLLPDMGSGDCNARGMDKTPLSGAVRRAPAKFINYTNIQSDDCQQCQARPPLSWAAEKTHEAIVQGLLEGVDTPLSRAAANGHKAIVRLLVEKGADIESKDSYEQISPPLAAANGDEETVQQLVEESADVDLKDSHGQTPLSRAAANGHEVIVRLLVEKGANIESKDSYGQTPLSWAAANGHEVIVQQLLATGRVDADTKDNYGRTPISWAAAKGQEAIVKLLLATGKVDADTKDNDGRTPISWAAAKGQEAIVKLLLATGEVDVDGKDNDGRTPLLWAAAKYIDRINNIEMGRMSNRSLQDDEKQIWLLEHMNREMFRMALGGRDNVIQQLLETGKVDIDIKDKDGRTPLSWAAANGNEDIVPLLLTTGKVDIDTKDNDGRTPLSWAAAKGSEDVVQQLLETGKVDIDIKDKDGRTPLSWAAANGHEDVVQQLLETGKVDIDAEDKDGQTPISWATANGDEDMVQQLLKTGKVDL